MNARTTYGARDCSDYRVAQKTENTTIIVDLTILGPDFQKILGKT